MNHICLLKACHLVVKNKASRFVCFFFSYCIGALPFIIPALSLHALTFPLAMNGRAFSILIQQEKKGCNH